MNSGGFQGGVSVGAPKLIALKTILPSVLKPSQPLLGFRRYSATVKHVKLLSDGNQGLCDHLIVPGHGQCFG